MEIEHPLQDLGHVLPAQEQVPAGVALPFHGGIAVVIEAEVVLHDT